MEAGGPRTPGPTCLSPPRADLTCPERTTFSRAITEGYRPGDFLVAAITASPCGGCRQWLVEMGVERVLFRNGGRIIEMSPDELLPEQFDAGQLGA